jgi:hypothetical protein
MDLACTGEETDAQSAYGARFHDILRSSQPARLSLNSSDQSGEFNMNWTQYIAYFFGGVFLANAIPHTVSGMMGRAFQSPFAKPPGEGLSSSTVNVVWGFFNAMAGYLLVFHVGAFELHSISDVIALWSGAFLIALLLARHFGKFHGGNSPDV